MDLDISRGELRADGEQSTAQEIAAIRNLMSEFFVQLLLDLAGLGPAVRYGTPGGLKHERRVAREGAYAYIFDGEMGEPWSFEYVCAHLELDVDEVRAAVRSGKYLDWVGVLVSTRRTAVRPTREPVAEVA